MTLILEPRARREMYRAAVWHEKRRLGYGDLFLPTCGDAFQFIATHPGLGTPLSGEFRRFALPRFPYSIVYRERANGIVIFAVAHHKRRPGYWRRRLQHGSEG